MQKTARRLYPANDTKITKKMQEINYDSERLSNCDLAVGCNGGKIKIFDLSHHFKNTKFDEVKIMSAQNNLQV